MVIRSFWPGATARQVEQQLTDRIERKLQETPGIERVSSYSRPGESTVLFVARDSTPPAQVPEIFYQVRKKVGDIRHTLPAGVQGPFFNDEYGDVLGNIYALTAKGSITRNLRTRPSASQRSGFQPTKYTVKRSSSSSTNPSSSRGSRTLM